MLSCCCVMESHEPQWPASGSLVKAAAPADVLALPGLVWAAGIMLPHEQLAPIASTDELAACAIRAPNGCAAMAHHHHLLARRFAHLMARSAQRSLTLCVLKECRQILPVPAAAALLSPACGQRDTHQMQGVKSLPSLWCSTKLQAHCPRRAHPPYLHSKQAQSRAGLNKAKHQLDRALTLTSLSPPAVARYPAGWNDSE